MHDSDSLRESEPQSVTASHSPSASPSHSSSPPHLDLDVVSDSDSSLSSRFCSSGGNDVRYIPEEVNQFMGQLQERNDGNMEGDTNELPLCHATSHLSMDF